VHSCNERDNFLVAKEIQNFLVNHIHDNELRRYASHYCRGRLIDIGCGTKPYRDLLHPFVAEHIGMDHIATPHDKTQVDLWGSAYEIPAENEIFDSALCTAVLEHLEEPEKALQECLRVLKPGGHAIYSVPFIWHLHEEPRDFFRFSRYGLKYLFEKTGFEVVEIKALSGFWVTFGQLLVYNLYRYNKGFIRWLYIIDLLGIIIQFVSWILDQLDKSDQWTWMYMAVVKKPVTI
jgi:SAM-dependent methyltransferase